MNISVIDLGINNVASLNRTLRSIFQEAIITTLSDTSMFTASADVLLLPGVGNFGVASKALQETNLMECILDFSRSGKGIIGICLGMQLLLNASDESSKTLGIGLIRGKAKKLDVKQARVPNTGWSTIQVKHDDQLSQLVTPDSCFYFNHSYVAEVERQYIRAESQHGAVTFPAIIQSENVIGIQFHPEKSGLEGKLLLKYVIEEIIKG